MKYAKALQERLDQLGMSKQQLSEESGVPYTTVTNMFKRGAATAGLKNVFAVCRALQINPNDLFNQDGQEEEFMTPEHKALSNAYDTAPELLKQAIWRVLDTKRPASSSPSETDAPKVVAYNTEEAKPSKDKDEYEYITLAANDDGVPSDVARREAEQALREAEAKYGKRIRKE